MKNSKKKQDNIASEIKFLIAKQYCSQATAPAQILKRPAACLCSPAWALGPAADGWAGEAAQRRLPPGLIVARIAASASPPSIGRSTAEITPAHIAPI
jgi:hypothetical protein